MFLFLSLLPFFAARVLQIVVWVALSQSQRRDYVAYLGGESVLDVLSGKISSPLAAIQALKKVMLSYWLLVGAMVYVLWRSTARHRLPLGWGGGGISIIPGGVLKCCLSQSYDH